MRVAYFTPPAKAMRLPAEAARRSSRFSPKGGSCQSARTAGAAAMRRRTISPTRRAGAMPWVVKRVLGTSGDGRAARIPQREGLPRPAHRNNSGRRLSRVRPD